MDKFINKTQMQTILDARPKGVSMDDVIRGYRSNGYKVEGIDEVAKPEPTIGNKLASTAKETLGGMIDNTKQVLTGKKDPVAGLTQNVGELAGGAIKATGDVLSSTPVVKDVIGAVAEPVGQGIAKVQDWLSNNPTFQGLVDNEAANKIASFLESNPEIGNNAEAINNIANAVLLAKGGLQSASTITKGTTAVVGGVGKGVTTAVETVAPVVKGASDIITTTGKALARVPARVKTNLAEKQAVEAEIKSLPNQKAQIAVRDGVDINDVKEITSISRTPEANKLIQTVKDYAKGNKKVDPIEVVGEQAVKRFKEISKQKKEIGAELGEASKTIGILTKPELQTGVLARLKSVSGLENLTSKNGILDFSKTRLNTTLSKSDRTAIQEAYREATKWGDGEKAHQFRQTLFETLGGKKKGKVEVTDTQEQAFEAIRGGLSDVIETKSPKYKTLSNEYRKIIEPIRELQKKLKTLDPNTEDLSDTNLSAGILARRITSTAVSNPEIRQLLKNLDEVGKTKGSSFEKTMQLQELYNILNKYYDIAPKTGFQNLSREGLGGDSLTGIIKEGLKNVAGNSNAVRQKALEELLDSIR